LNTLIESPALFYLLGIFMKITRSLIGGSNFSCDGFGLQMSAAEAEEAQDAAGKESVKDHLSCNLRVRVDFLVSITFDRA
jgi:hypothetical protein